VNKDLLDRVWEQVNRQVAPPPGEKFTYQRAFATLKSFPQGFEMLFAVHYADVDIVNGGFRQYFGNPTSIGAAAAYKVFRAIGSKVRANALLQAMAKVVSESRSLVNFDVDDEVRAAAQRGVAESYEELAKSYYSARTSEPMRALMEKFVSENFESLFK
jgi:hypothetical protein